MSSDDARVPGQGFEDHFRGSREEILRRLAFYLPFFEAAGVRDLDGPVLDLGCGRCEWLELLAGQDYTVCGIDGSEEVVTRAVEAGYDVVLADLFEHLRGRPDASLAGVTAFHVVEHVDPIALGGLIAEIHRVLLPGGVVVLETQNPENVKVGAGSFYIDPTHERPVPPPLLEFQARDAGFERPWIARLNAEVLGVPLPEAPSGLPGALQLNAAVQALNSVLFAPPDYALVAQKAPSALDDAALERALGPRPADLATSRLWAAEETARELEARLLAATEQAAEAERRARESAELAERLESERDELRAEREAAAAAFQEAEASALNGLAKAADAEARLQVAEERFSVVESSLSWRLTAPLRLTAKVARVLRGLGGGGEDEHSPKRLAKLAVGHPMRWVLSRPRLGPAVDRRLATVPSVDRKVRVALYEVEVTRHRAARAPVPGVADDLLGEPEGVREVVADLEAALGPEDE